MGWTNDVAGHAFFKYFFGVGKLNPHSLRFLGVISSFMGEREEGGMEMGREWREIYETSLKEN